MTTCRNCLITINTSTNFLFEIKYQTLYAFNFTHDVFRAMFKFYQFETQMERKPEKKEALQRVNNALTTTNRLINETSNGIFGLTKNTIFYSLSKVVVLSALSGAVSDLLGFKVKMWKLKDWWDCLCNKVDCKQC